MKDHTRTITDLAYLTTPIAHGTTDHPHTITRLELAIEHLHDWTAHTQPPTTTQRGGTSSPTETDDRTRSARLHTNCLTDQAHLDRILKDIKILAMTAKVIVARYTETITPDKLATLTTDTLPGCTSCARANHFAPTYDKSQTSKLCRWCYDYHQAFGTWPPIKACDLYHREGPRTAGNWIAKHVGVASR